MKAAKGSPQAMNERQREISVRVEMIEDEKHATAVRVFEAWFPDVQAICHAAERGFFLDLLDGSAWDFCDFQAKTNCAAAPLKRRKGLLLSRFLTDLTGPERSPEWVRGQRWYRGRV
ncbi:MAG: hypothetical protein WCF30_09410 [Terracidiphilus sp.]